MSLLPSIQLDKVNQGHIFLPDNVFPSWDKVIPYFDKQALVNRRAKNVKKIFVNLNHTSEAFFTMFYIMRSELQRIGIKTTSCHIYAGLGTEVFASPVHKDPMTVFVVQALGSCDWKVFENGEDQRATISKRMVPGDWIYIPKGIAHAAFPDSSRALLSFGIGEDNE